MRAIDGAPTPLPEEVADAVPALICYVDRFQRYRFVNRAYEQWFGIARADILGRTVAEVLGPVAYPKAAPHVEAALAGEAQRFEVMVPHVSGPPRLVEAQYLPDRDPDGAVRGYYGLILGQSEAEVRSKADRERVAELDRRHTFLLDLADALHVLEEPADLMTEASSRVGRFLGVGRAGYGEVAPDSPNMTLYGQWTDGLQPDLTSARRTGRLTKDASDALRRGEALRIDDVATDPRSCAQADSYRETGIGALVVAPRLRQGRLDAVFYVHHPAPRSWTDDDVALVQDVAARTWSAVARARSERALRESEARFRGMADSAPAPVWVTGVDGAVEFGKQPFAALIGLPRDEPLGDRWITFVHPDDLPAVARARDAGRAGPDPYEFEARFRDATGQWRWMRATSKPRFNDAGVFQGYVGMAVDITESRAAVDRQQLLINELNHRVKNTLATVQSLAHQTLRDGVVIRDARERFTDRLLALSAAHNVLTRENWEGAEVREVVADAVRPYDDAALARVAFDGPPLRIAPNVALALSMALHELATNAVKYGALSIPGGQVRIGWTASAGEAAELEWREIGGPPVTAPARLGFGSRLLRQGLAAELGAPAALDYARTGLVGRLRVPVTEV